MRRRTSVLAVAVLLASLGVALAPSASATSTVGPGFSLRPGKSLVSNANGYKLVMQGDGNLVQYTNNNVPLWSSRTGGRGASAMTLQSDGNLVVRTVSGSVATWSSRTHGGNKLALQDDGNLVLYAGTTKLWCTCALHVRRVTGQPSSMTLGQGMLAGDALVAGTHKLVMQGDGNLVLYGPAGAMWNTHTSLGYHTYLALQSDGNLVLRGPANQALWTSNTGGRGVRTLGFASDGNLRLTTAGGAVVWTTARNTPTGIAGDVFALLNRQRAANGLPALTSDPRLIASAAAHNAKMSAADSLQHQLPGEADPGARITAAGYAWRAWAENIAWTSDTSSAGAQSMQTAMYNEKPPNDGHRQNILSRAVTQVGVAVLVDARGKLWLTTNFAAPR